MNLHVKRQDFLQNIGSFAQLLPLLDLLPDVSFFMKDAKGRFIALNRRGCEYCGVKSEREALGKTDRDFFPRVRAAEYAADDKAVMKSGKPILNRVEAAPEMEGSPRLVVTNLCFSFWSRDNLVCGKIFLYHFELMVSRQSSECLVLSEAA